MDLGSNSVPDSAERCAESSTHHSMLSIDSLGREMRVSALGDGEGILEEIRVVEERVAKYGFSKRSEGFLCRFFEFFSR